MSTAYDRFRPRRSKNRTAGSSPAARKSDDHDQHQRGADGLDLHGQPQRDQDAEPAEEADVEGRVPVERRPGLAEVVVVGAGRLAVSSSCSGSAGGVSRGASLTHSSSPNPATTSRSEASWAVIASRRLAIRSTSARIAASSRSASAAPEAWIDSAWVRARADDLLGLAAGPAEQCLGLGWRAWPRCSVAWAVALAGALLGGRGALLGLLRPGAGSRPVALAWWSVASRASRSFSTASVRRASWTSRSAAARSCSASRLAVVRSSLVSCSAASRSWSASPLGGGDQVLGLAAGQRTLLLGVGGQAAAVLVELLELDQAHVLGLAGGVGADRLGVAVGLRADLGGVALGGLADLAGLLLGEPQHRGGAATEPGVRRVLVLGELGLEGGDLLLEVDRAALGLGQAVAEPGLLAAELAELRVDGVAVVAAAADHRERGRRRRPGGGLCRGPGGRRRDRSRCRLPAPAGRSASRLASAWRGGTAGIT